MNAFQTAPSGKKTLTVAGIYIGLLASLIHSSSLATVLPVAAQEIGGMDIYPLASMIGGILGVIAMPLYAFLGAKNPAVKRILVVISLCAGIVVLLTRALTSSMMFIVIMSIPYSLVSTGLFVIGYSMIRDMYDQKQAGIYLGFVGTMMSIGMLVGPVITGFLIDTLGWRAVCHVIWVGMAVAALLIFTGVKVTKEQVKDMARDINFDLPGTLFLAVFLACFILPLSFGRNYIPFGTPLNYLLLVLAVISVVALAMVIRKKGADAIVPAPALKDKTTVILFGCNFLLIGSSMAVYFFIPSYIIYVLEQSALFATVASAMMGVLGVFMGPILGRSIAKSGNARSVLTSGTIVRIAVTLAFIFLLKPGTSIYLVWVLMFIAGFYNVQQTVTFSAAPQIQIRPDIRIQSNAVIQMAQTLGSVVGMVVYNFIISDPNLGIVNGLPIAFWVAIGTAAVALILGLFLKKLPEESV